MVKPILGAGELLPHLFRAETRVQAFAELLAAQDAAIAALLTAYSVPEGAQDTHQRHTEEHRLMLAAIVARIRSVRHGLSELLP
ncbi:MAG TPA: hypothetical protein PKB14_25465 [Rubrivivax sp.]|nr:hypothetical protein [Rubrivivax sp.]